MRDSWWETDRAEKSGRQPEDGRRELNSPSSCASFARTSNNEGWRHYTKKLNLKPKG